MSISYPGRTIYPAMGRLNKRPSYNCSSAGTEITVPGSSSSPAVVMIDGKIYENVADVTCDLDTTGAISAGRGSIDTGSIAANIPYYLYGISGVSGLGFDVIASADPPTTGPTGFTSWTYIGACATRDTLASFNTFRSSGGVLRREFTSGYHLHIEDANIYTAIDVKIPVHAHSVYLWLSLSSINAALDKGYISMDGSTGTITNEAVTTSDNVNTGIELALREAQTIYAKTLNNAGGNTATRIDIYIMGWQEDPMEYA